MAYPTEGARYWPVDRQYDDWPKGVSEPEKEVLVRIVRKHLETWKSADLDQLHEAIRRHPDQPECYKGAVLWSWLYAVCDRAARGAGNVSHTYTLHNDGLPDDSIHRRQRCHRCDRIANYKSQVFPVCEEHRGES